jgi:uncharacterized membrane protein YidH (DUF202 family)
MKIVFNIFALFVALLSFGQTPQNVDRGSDRGINIWESTEALIFVVACIVLLIVARKWDKIIHAFRDKFAANKEEENK